ncbi:CoA transferase, partial [Streptomyces sp. Agncl-13]|uniref:CoA transferase n=1 Tax=Streptomyces sp. Agncl-13 TaxID=3400628 RepID=UPI003A87CF49
MISSLSRAASAGRSRRDRARAKLRIDVEDIRAINPDIIYVRGSGFGPRGDEATKGGYDST